VPLDVRFVAASKRDLGAAAARGGFRADLLYRLNVVTIHMPGPGRAAGGYPAIVPQASRRRLPPQADKPVPDVAPDVLGRIAARDWPGHVRELRNAAERMALGLEIGRAGAPDTDGLPCPTAWQPMKRR
jgi:two-component system C4-dicarboxylate transport response regulator DctD